jgi:hypothetical protein
MRHASDTNPRPWVYWLILSIGFVLAVLAVFGCGTPSVAIPRPEPDVCTDWQPMEDANFGDGEGATTTDVSIVHFRTCRSTVEFMRLEDWSGHTELLGRPVDEELHFRWDICPSTVAVQRCRS